MAVALTISESLDGAAVADSLEGGGTGVDLGNVTNGSYAPVVNQTNNEGAQNLYVRHDATIDPITDLKCFMQTYGAGTGATYGGADSAANDFTTMTGYGNTSGSSKNNQDGNSAGLWMDANAQVATVSQFDFATNGQGQGGDDTVFIFGDNGTDGIDLASAFLIPGEAMVYDNTGETAASAPVDGEVGVSGDTAKGDNARLKYRAYLPDSALSGGIIQFEIVFSYSFTA
jgi:hypothetical protein